MSRGFVKESDQEEAPFVPPRAVLPEGVTNYVTPRGLRLLHEERERLEAERAEYAGRTDDEGRRGWGVAQQRLLQLEERLASARVVEPEEVADGEVRFGSTVRYRVVRPRAGKPTDLTIVGVDEADVKARRVSFLSPLARALLGKRVGEEATLRLEREERVLVVEGIG